MVRNVILRFRPRTAQVYGGNPAYFWYTQCFTALPNGREILWAAFTPPRCQDMRRNSHPPRLRDEKVIFMGMLIFYRLQPWFASYRPKRTPYFSAPQWIYEALCVPLWLLEAQQRQDSRIISTFQVHLQVSRSPALPHLWKVTGRAREACQPTRTRLPYGQGEETLSADNW
jgi:hypothetical protein